MMNGKTLVFQFDDVRVEPESFRVWKAESAVQLEPKAFEVLLFLIQNRGRLVQKRELLDAVWKDAFVTENALTREIAQLRKALGDEVKQAKYIETVPRRGYRFIAEVKDSVEAENTGNGRPHAPEPPVHPGAKVSGAGSGLRRAVSLPGIVLLVGVIGLLFVAGIAFKNLRVKPSDEAIGVRRLTQVTTSVGLDIYPSLSPDGSYVAYSSNRNGNFEIYVKQLAQGGREIQITSDGEQNLQPSWSPDGQHIAFYSKNRGGIWIVPALGGVARRLIEFGSRPAWSRDGEWIAFQSAALSDLAGPAAGAMPPSTIWVMPARGGQARQITRAGVPSGGHGSPVWAPDGKRIVFFAYDVAMIEIWSVSPQGGELKQLAPDRQPFSSLAFSPDGKYVYCAGIFKGATFGLWRVPVSVTSGEVTDEPVKVEGIGATPIRHLSISADGKKIAYNTQSLASDIWSVPLSRDSGEVAGAPSPLFEDTSLRKTNPAFSPDGRKIAFGVWRLGSPGNVWLIDADGKNPTQLTADPAGSSFPSWLPHGEQVAFVSNQQRRPVLRVKKLQSGEEALLSALDRDVDMPRLSPDGTQIAFNSRRAGGVINVWTARLDGGQRKQLTFGEGLMGFPCWSPDGKFIAFEVLRGDDTHVAVMPSSGGEATQLTSEPGQSWPHSWSPDGRRIAFAGYRNGAWNIWWVSLDDKTQKQLTNFSKSNAFVRYPTWSPLGDQVAFEYAEIKGNVWLMELQ